MLGVHECIVIVILHFSEKKETPSTDPLGNRNTKILQFIRILLSLFLYICKFIILMWYIIKSIIYSNCQSLYNVTKTALTRSENSNTQSKDEKNNIAFLYVLFFINSNIFSSKLFPCQRNGGALCILI